MDLVGVTEASVSTFFVKACSLCATESKVLGCQRCLFARGSRFPKICLRVAQGMYFCKCMDLLTEICMHAKHLKAIGSPPKNNKLSIYSCDAVVLRDPRCMIQKAHSACQWQALGAPWLGEHYPGVQVHM